MEDEIDILSILEDSEEEDGEKSPRKYSGGKEITIIPNDVHDFYLKEEELENKIAINNMLLEKLRIELNDSKLKFATNKMIVQNVSNKNKFKFLLKFFFQSIFQIFSPLLTFFPKNRLCLKTK